MKEIRLTETNAAVRLEEVTAEGVGERRGGGFCLPCVLLHSESERYEFAQGLAPLAPGSGRRHAACLLVCSSI